ncbi:serine hydrolase [Flammeovirgaceae bacterium SG7u.111]|nr:serine hydrolase [Flammeovirgaceae bacterium SG7u.132]WPO37531.1 serine hydrolase [Flammeovirgaceae bacterium SG7u.111]
MKLIIYPATFLLFLCFYPLLFAQDSLQNPTLLVGMDTTFLSQKIDSIVELGLSEEAFPGCQVLVARNGETVFQKAYGFHTYEQNLAVELNHLYDLASISKISAALPLLMQLYEEEKIKLDEPFATYWDDFQGTDKEKMTVREVLAHQAQLKPYIVYWANAVKKNGKFKWRTFKEKPKKKYSVKVSDSLFLHEKYRKKIYKAIKKSALEPVREYKYSGLSFLLYPQIIENLTGQEMESRVRERFYGPLGADRLTFNPWNKFPMEEIVPSEFDSVFRKRLVQGYVHDEAAAMLGGVSGNAGLFANAESLAKLIQMYLNGGEYEGKRYLKEETLQEFTSYQFKDEGSRRGLGFDKPRLEDLENGFPAVAASERSFGHSGFTGTFTWADPENGLLLVFLSNRVYPTRTNRKTYQLEIYQQIHEAMYEAIKE